MLIAAIVAGCSGEGEGSEPALDAACGAEKFHPDADGDGFGDSSIESCEPLAGYVAKGGDCSDNNAAVHPMAVEICDAIDNNCDGTIDDADPNVDKSTGTTYHEDADGDGFGAVASTRQACTQPAGFVESATDCDDAAAAVNPSASEICDSIDNDCDGLLDTADPSIDLSTAQSYFRDADNDTFGTGPATVACSQPTGFVPTSGDCNDGDNTAHPGGIEVCDGVDNDCDGGNDGTAAAPNRCTALVGSYGGSYQHLAQEKLGNTVINSMSCSGTGSGSLLLNRKPALQGTFTCIYNGGLGGFSQNQRVTLNASVRLDGTVTGTVEHAYDSFSLKRTYNVTGTQTATNLTLTGTGSFFPNPMSAVPWQVTFSFAATK